MDGMKKREKLENQKLEKLEKPGGPSPPWGGESPWNGFGRRLRRRYACGFGSANEQMNTR